MAKRISLSFLSLFEGESNNYQHERISDLEEEIAVELEGMSQLVIPLTDEIKYGNTVEFHFNKAMLV
jgi:hypothetical protein